MFFQPILIFSLISIILIPGSLVFASESGTWSTTGSLHTARCRHSATLLPSGEILVAGGYSGATTSTNPSEQFSLSSCELYDPSSGTWSVTGSMNTPRIYHTATLLPDGNVLAAGGYDPTNNGIGLNSCELYNPVSGTWSITGSMSINRIDHTATLLSNGQVLVAGGSDGSGNILNSCEVYDPTAGFWFLKGSLNNARRAGHTAINLTNGEVLVAGGSTGYGSVILNSCELFNPAICIWSPTDSMSTPRIWFSTSLLHDGKVLVAGGFYANNIQYLLNSCELYDPVSGAWSITGSMSTSCAEHTATMLCNGKLLVVGGLISDHATSSCESYTAQENGSPVGPVPELPAGALLGIGLAGLGVYTPTKKMKAGVKNYHKS
jgi:hypothetical protein